MIWKIRDIGISPVLERQSGMNLSLVRFPGLPPSPFIPNGRGTVLSRQVLKVRILSWAPYFRVHLTRQNLGEFYNRTKIFANEAPTSKTHSV